MPNVIDLMHLGNDRVIAAHELDAGLIVDPGPASCVETLLAGLETQPRALLLTHIHLDHAGASGVLARRFPRLRVYVHEVGAPHLADPAKLLRSAERLYGDDMERLWGEVAPVPSERIRAVGGGDRVAALDVIETPGHASHHVAYFDRANGDAYVGDVAGVRIAPDGPTIAPTPPPEIDLEAWERSLDAVAGWRPQRLRLTHFGEVGAEEGLEAMREALGAAREASRGGDRERFEAAVAAELDGAGPDVTERVRQATPTEQRWLGLERYWAKRAEAEASQVS
jgi:glyoxylase-like metal-dependent hydrolase (beta-lactamase superfamily II)